MSMGYCKKDVTALLMHMSYVFLHHVDGLLQETRNSISHALELTSFLH